MDELEKDYFFSFLTLQAYISRFLYTEWKIRGTSYAMKIKLKHTLRNKKYQSFNFALKKVSLNFKTSWT